MYSTARRTLENYPQLVLGSTSLFGALCDFPSSYGMLSPSESEWAILNRILFPLFERWHSVSRSTACNCWVYFTIVNKNCKKDAAYTKTHWSALQWCEDFRMLHIQRLNSNLGLALTFWRTCPCLPMCLELTSYDK